METIYDNKLGDRLFLNVCQLQRVLLFYKTIVSHACICLISFLKIVQTYEQLKKKTASMSEKHTTRKVYLYGKENI